MAPAPGATARPPIETHIVATGMAVPPCVVDNHLLSRCMTTSDEWIVQRSGIRERRVSPDTYRMLERLAAAPDKAAFMRQVFTEGVDGSIDATMSVSDLGLEASLMALGRAGLTAADLDCLVVSTTIPDYAYPHTGCVLQGRLGLTTTPVFNLQQGCAGFVFGLAMADRFITSGLYRRVLVVGAELLSTILDYTDAGRDMAVLFADGAGAVVCAAADGVPSAPRRGVLACHLHTDGTVLDGLRGELYGSSTYPAVSMKKIADGRARPRMNGRAVFTQAVRRCREVIQECLDAAGLAASDVDCYLLHQANVRILDAVREAFGIPRERVFVNVDRYGNTAAASVPICLHEALAEGRVRPGHLVMMVGFGTGFSWGASLVRW
jgi:3-oxoacyl-[acyl-carrier-protein] synthase-3